MAVFFLFLPDVDLPVRQADPCSKYQRLDFRLDILPIPPLIFTGPGVKSHKFGLEFRSHRLWVTPVTKRRNLSEIWNIP